MHPFDSIYFPLLGSIRVHGKNEGIIYIVVIIIKIIILDTKKPV